MVNPERRMAVLPHVEERRFRHLVETFAQALWEAGPDGELLPGSESWPILTGQAEASSLGRGWLDAVHPDDRAGVEAAWIKAVAEGSVYQREYRVRRNGHGWVWTLAHAAPLQAEDSRPQKWLGMNVDISARKNAEQALREADRQKDEFIAILAHELRNPLTPLRSGIDLMLNETATSTAKARALALMNRQTFHLSRLVEDLIDASRITTGSLQLHLEKVRLAEVLRGSVESIAPATQAKRQEIALQGLDEIDPVLHADPVRLNQAFVNVLNNSTSARNARRSTSPCAARASWCR
jgi:PAS domain S-box-containing protein